MPCLLVPQLIVYRLSFIVYKTELKNSINNNKESPSSKFSFWQGPLASYCYNRKTPNNSSSLQYVGIGR